MCIFCFFFFFPSQLCCPLIFRNSPQTRWWEGFLVFGNFSSLWLPPQDGSPSLILLSLFLLLYFVLPPFKDNGLPFWEPGVLCHSEVVLWNLLSVQMIFQWICGGESGLPVLFLHHLRATPPKHVLFTECCSHWFHIASVFTFNSFLLITVGGLSTTSTATSRVSAGFTHISNSTPSSHLKCLFFGTTSCTSYS